MRRSSPFKSATDAGSERCKVLDNNFHQLAKRLEKPKSVPVVIEDEVMISSRCMVVEGARVRTGAVLGAGTILTASTHVIDAQTGEDLPRGEVPAWSVCVGGTRTRKFPGGEFGLPCVLVLKRLAEGDRHDKAALNEVLREHGANA